MCEFIQKLSNYIHYQIVYNTSYHSHIFTYIYQF